MKRRNFLKAIGIGAVIAPAVLSAEIRRHNNRKLDLAMHKAHVRDNPYTAAFKLPTRDEILNYEKQWNRLAIDKKNYSGLYRVG